jgi:UDP-GlcNAc:undecaprenyl-phosphate GlcNAc-1-phosphate transferase
MFEGMEVFEKAFASLGFYIVVLIASYILMMIAFPFLLQLFKEAGFVKPNYRGEQIPAVAGLIFAVMIPFITGLGMVLRVKSFINYEVFLFQFVIIGMALLGFLDDRMGDHGVKGFRGHFRTLFKEGRLTTGVFKAFYGAFIAFGFAMGTALLAKKAVVVPWKVLVDFLLVALAANTMNLFDLRPGRAGKIYIVSFLIILAVSSHFEKHFGMFIPILAMVFYYLPFDLEGKVMMGDVGSNLLGASLGMMMVWMMGDIGKIVTLVLLIILHILAERYSFTTIIDNTSWLKKIDSIGRRIE